MSKKVLVPIGDGTEELEAVSIIDVLRRVGASVTVASVGRLQVTACRGVKLVADRLITGCMNKTYDLIVLPGGMPGAERLRDSKELEMLLKRQHGEGRFMEPSVPRQPLCSSIMVFWPKSEPRVILVLSINWKTWMQANREWSWMARVSQVKGREPLWSFR